MFCKKCGNTISETEKFCSKCGMQISEFESISKEAKKNMNNATQVTEHKLNDAHIKKLSHSFMDINEKFISSLGNGYILNFLANGSISQGFSFVTDKRVYFKGTCYSGQGTNLTITNEERTVDVKNITGSGFLKTSSIGYLIGGILLLIIAAGFLCSALLNGLYGYDEGIGAAITLLGIAFALLIPAIRCLKEYLKGKTLFRIEYAGGCIAFDVSFYAMAEVQDFQKQIRRAKDYAEQDTIVKTKELTNSTSVSNSSPDDLRKYAELLKDGLISQDEFDAMKKKLLGL